ncbi:MAG: alpha/beta fold hydrolase [Chitinophagaceae bacterium]
MNYIRTKDGIQLAYTVSGKGKPFIIVGGSLADHTMYEPLASVLSSQFKVFNYDRRNRGNSATAVHHTIDDEINDLALLASLCNEPPVIYGHSAGAALAIRTVAAGISIDKLILADLPYSPNTESNEVEAEKFAEERNMIVSLLNDNNKTGAVKYFLKNFGMNEQELDQFLKSKNGEQALVNSATLPVDYDMLGSGLAPTELLMKIRFPTLILTSPSGLEIAEDVAEHIKNCELSVLDNPTYHLSSNEIAKPIIAFLTKVNE